MKKIIIINGPNLNLLGNRENEVYGNTSFEEIRKECLEKSKDLSLECFFCQSNSEGDIIDFVHLAQEKYNGVI